MRTITISTPGPQGPVGPQGTPGASGSAGSSAPFTNIQTGVWATTSSLQLTGSLNATSVVKATSLQASGISTLATTFLYGYLTEDNNSNRIYLNANELDFWTNGSSTMRLTKATKNVLIGTTTDSGYKLDVSGSISSTTVTGYNSTTTDGNIVMRHTNGSSVAIGVTSDNNLRIKAPSMTLLNGTTEMWFGRFNMASIQAFSGDFGVFTSGDVERLRIKGSTGETWVSGSLRVSGSTQITGSLAVSSGIAINTSPSTFNLDTAISTTGGVRFNGALGGNLSYTYAEYIGAYYVAGWNSTGNIGLRSGASQRILISNTDQPAGITLFGNRIGIANATPSAKLHITGEGSGSATTALRVENTNASASMVVLDNGNVGIGTTTPSRTLDVNGSVGITGNILIPTQTGYGVYANFFDGNSPAFLYGSSTVYSAGSTTLVANTTSGVKRIYSDTTAFNASTGSASFASFYAAPTISQSSAATGITRGLFVDPILTAAANFRAIETTSGSVLFSHGATPLMFISSSGFVGVGTTTDNGNKLYVNGTAWVENNLSLGNEGKLQGSFGGGLQLIAAQSNTAQNVRISQGVSTTFASASALLQVDSTTKGFLPPRMTNAQRAAISTPAVGLMVYCTDATEGLYIYKSTGWTFIV